MSFEPLDILKAMMRATKTAQAAKNLRYHITPVFF
jgi:hypothetical protein